MQDQAGDQNRTSLTVTQKRVFLKVFLKAVVINPVQQVDTDFYQRPSMLRQATQVIWNQELQTDIEGTYPAPFNEQPIPYVVTARAGNVNPSRVIPPAFMV